MTTTHPPASMLERFDPDLVDEAEIAAASFLARYNGRTLEVYRYDLRCFSNGLSTQAWLSSRRRGHPSRCTAAGSKNEDSLPPPSTVGRRRSVASTGSRTSTVASRRTRRST